MTNLNSLVLKTDFGKTSNFNESRGNIWYSSDIMGCFFGNITTFPTF